MSRSGISLKGENGAHYRDWVRPGTHLPCNCLSPESHLLTQLYQQPHTCPAAPLTLFSALHTTSSPRCVAGAQQPASRLSHRLHLGSLHLQREHTSPTWPWLRRPYSGLLPLEPALLLEHVRPTFPVPSHP